MQSCCPAHTFMRWQIKGLIRSLDEDFIVVSIIFKCEGNLEINILVEHLCCFHYKASLRIKSSKSEIS